MENFKCYEIHRANMPQYGCTQQCDECKSIQVTSIPHEEPMMEVPMPVSKGKDPIIEAAEKWVFEKNGRKWSNNNNEAGDNFGSFRAGADWMAKSYKLDLFNAMEYGLDYGYQQGFSDASQEAVEYKELSHLDIFADYMKEPKEEPVESFSKDQMFLFAGYCMGKRMLNPTRDVSEILEEFMEDFKNNSL